MNKKKILSLLLVLVMLVGMLPVSALADDEPAAEPTTEASAPAPAAEPEPAPATEPEPAPAAEPEPAPAAEPEPAPAAEPEPAPAAEPEPAPEVEPDPAPAEEPAVEGPAAEEPAEEPETEELAAEELTVEESTEESAEVPEQDIVEEPGKSVSNEAANAEADEWPKTGMFGAEGNNLTWELSQIGVLTISGTGAMQDFNSAMTDVPWKEYKDQILSVVVQGEVSNIGSYAFTQCPNLKSASLGPVTSLGTQAFAGCTNLSSVDLGHTTQIGLRAFNTCSSLTSMDMSGVEAIDQFCFTGTPLTSANLTSIKSIGPFAFQGVQEIKSVTLGNNLETVGNAAFAFTGITELTIPGSISSFGTSVFATCTALTAVTVTDGATQIPLDTFKGDNRLAEISLPVSLTTVGNNAFNTCTSLARVEYPGTEDQWDAINIGTGNESLINAKKKTDGTFVSATGIMLSTSELTLVAFHSEQLTATVAPADATDQTVIWESSDTDIVTVSNSGVVEAKGPVGTVTVTAQTSEVSTTCTVTVEANPKVPTSAVAYGMAGTDSNGELALWYLTNEGVLHIVSDNGGSISVWSNASSAPWYSYKDSIVELVIGEGITSIGRYSYMNYGNLDKVSLPSTLTNIDRQSFGNSGTVISTVNYAGTEEQWAQVTKGATNNRLINSTGFNFVQPVTTDHLEISGGKREYEIGEEFDPTGLTVMAVNSDGTEQDVTSEVTITGFDSSMAGENTLTVTYGEGESTVSATFTVTVVPKQEASAGDGFVFTFAGNNLETVVAIPEKNSDNSYDVYFPAWAIDQRNCTITISASEEITGDFSVSYVAYQYTSSSEKTVNSDNGTVVLSDYASGRSYSESVIITIVDTDEQYTFNLVPYCAINSINVYEGTNSSGQAYPVTMIDEATYRLVIPKNTDIFMRIRAGIVNNNNGRTVTTVEGADKLNWTNFQYHVGEADEQILIISVTDDDYGMILDRSYTLIITAIDNDPVPVLNNYNGSPGSSVTVRVNQFEDAAIELEVENTNEDTEYKWYISGTAENIGNNTAIFEIDTSVPKIINLKCDVTNTYEGIRFSATTQIIRVVILPTTELAPPIIINQPQSAEYLAGNTPEAMTVSILVPGGISGGYKYYYQWFVNSTNSNTDGIAVGEKQVTPTGEGISYIPSTDTVGTKWYYCQITAVYSVATDEEYFSAPIETECAAITVEEPGLSLDGSGTQDDPFLIRTYDELVEFRDRVNEGNSYAGMYFKLVNNIELASDWVPIGCTVDGTQNVAAAGNFHPFSGTYDGNGKTVTIAAGGLPLFNYVHGATIKDLNIFGSQINGYGLINNMHGVGLHGTSVTISGIRLLSGTSVHKSGLLGCETSVNPAAGVSADYEAHISGCVIESGVTIGNGSQSYVGSFAGRFQGTIENCVSYATVTGAGYVGGIIGTRDNALGNCKVINCHFHGTVTASGDNVGGIVGGGYSNSTAPNGIRVTVQNCSSDGTVTGNKNVGGILGGDNYVAQAWNSYSFTGNSFTGTVSGSANVGGVIGFYDSLNVNDNIAGNYYKAGCGAAQGIGKVVYVDTSCSTHETSSGATYFNTESGTGGCPDVAGCQWQVGLQRNDDPLGADKKKLATSTQSSEPVVTDLDISGEYQTEYPVGAEALITDGIIVMAAYSDGTSKDVTAEAEFSGFDSSVAGEKKITVSFGGMSTTFTILFKNPEGTIKVKLSVLGDVLHPESTDVHGLWVGGLTEWMAESEFEIGSNDTVWVLLNKAFEEDDTLTLFSRYTEQYDSEYIYAVQKGELKLTEKDNNDNSGWMVAVNDKHVQVGVSNMYLKDGDTVILHWCDDYVIDEAAQGGDDDQQKIFEVEALIAAIAAASTPAEKQAAIKAAKDAYDALTDGEKAQVTNAQTLLDLLGGGLNLDTEDFKIVAGKTKTITAKDDEGKVLTDVLWTVETIWSPREDTDVVTVTNGKVKAVSIGAARITATHNGETKSVTASVLFTDVAKDTDFFFEPVYWAAQTGITTGKTATTFEPYSTCTRGQIVTFLWRMMGSPEPTDTANPFKDVKETDFFYKAVLWAKEKGITTGKTATTFEPYSSCTRGQIVTFLWRMTGSPEPTETANPFKDVAQKDFFYKAVLWAKEKGITTGKTATTFEPYSPCTRGQTVTFLWRYTNMNGSAGGRSRNADAEGAKSRS